MNALYELKSIFDVNFPMQWCFSALWIMLLPEIMQVKLSPTGSWISLMMLKPRSHCFSVHSALHVWLQRILLQISLLRKLIRAFVLIQSPAPWASLSINHTQLNLPKVCVWSGERYQRGAAVHLSCRDSGPGGFVCRTGSGASCGFTDRLRNKTLRGCCGKGLLTCCFPEGEEDS